MAVYLSPVGGVAAQFFDNNGTPLAGGLIYTYAAGTSTPATTYTSSSGIIAHSNPIVLDASGRVPTGEIWLSDVLAYKFVIKTAQDVLIASYDNISGINSNFVAYTAQQEIQTATAGQTLFTLTTMTYQPGTNNLAVYVDGVNQYGPGAQYAYVETDTDTVTFVSGLHVGASVKFTTATPVASAVVNAENVAYDPPFFGAVGTNVEAKLAQTVSVKDFGAVGDGVTDDTQAIQDAIDSGGEIYFPSGSYKITSALDVTVQGTSIVGANIVATTIVQHTLNEKIFNVTANDTAINGLTLDYSGSVSAGAIAIYCSGANPKYDNFKINKCDIGLQFVGSIIGFITNFKIYNYLRAGLWIENCGDQMFNNFLIDAINTTNGTLGGIFLNEFAEAICFVNGDILNGVYSLQTNATIVAPGQVPAHNSFTNVYFDSAAKGSYLDKCFTTQFVSCWFSGGRTSSGFSGLELRTCESVTFTGTRFVNNGSNGCLVSSLANRTTFNSCSFLGNSVTAGANVSSGLKLGANTTNVTVTSCTFRNSYFVGVQKYGIEIGNGCGYLLISDNNVQGNATAGIGILGVINNSKIIDNMGYNPIGGSSITVGASPFLYTAGPSPETIYIDGGTVSLIVTSGVSVFATTNKTIQLGPNEDVQVTYSSIPFMTKVVH